MARPLVACLLLVPLVLGTPLSAAELSGIQGADDRRPVISGGPGAGEDYPWPWRAIGRVNRNTGGFCTGTLIAPDLVLTAAHCLYNRRVGQLPPDSLHFVAAYRFGTYDAHGRIASIHRPDETGPRGDFVILRLRAPLPIRPLPLLAPLTGSRHKGIHAHVMLAGYSQDRPHLLGVDESCTILGLIQDPLWRHDCDGPKGSSGGPILISARPDSEAHEEANTAQDGDTAADEPRVAGISIGFTARGPLPRGVMIPTPVIRTFMREEGLLD